MRESPKAPPRPTLEAYLARGLSMEQMALEWERSSGISMTAMGMSHALRRQGLEPANQYAKPAQARVNLAELWRLKSEGVSDHEAAEALGSTYSTIRRVRLRHNIPSTHGNATRDVALFAQVPEAPWMW